MEISVGIVEDDSQIRDGMAALIHASPGYTCSFVFETAEQAILEIPSKHIDVVLMDVHLPGMSGVEAIRKLKQTGCHSQFVVFSSFDEDDLIFESLTVGAVGYLTKTTPPVKILEAIQDVMNGGSPMSGSIARKVISSFQKPKVESSFELLSQREQEIITLLSKGYRYKEIASQLFISVETTRTHIRNVYRKLEVNSSIDALNKLFKN